LKVPLDLNSQAKGPGSSSGTYLQGPRAHMFLQNFTIRNRYKKVVKNNGFHHF